MLFKKKNLALYNLIFTIALIQPNMIAVGHSGGVAEIIIAILPCTWTYYDYASRLKKYINRT